MVETQALTRLDIARRALDEARDLSEILAIRDIAEQARTAARMAKMGLEAENYAAEIKIRAERKAGELLAVMPKHPGHRFSGGCKLQPPVTPPTYAELEIDRTKAMRWQRIADVPEAVFEDHIASVLSGERERLTSYGLVKIANDLGRNQTDADAPTSTPEPDGRFATIVADPPWQYQNVATRAAAADHYPTLSVPQVCALSPWQRPVREHAADAAHLYLWTTNAFLRDAFEIVDAWGFTYKTTLVWVKRQLGIGNYFRSSHEFVLFGVRGSLHVRDSNQYSWFEDEGAGFKTDRGRHSQKPDCFYDLVQKVSPGPYLELFARKDLFSPRDGWTLWGNEA